MMGMILEAQDKSQYLSVTVAGEFSLPDAQRTFLETLDAIALHQSQRVLFDGLGIIGEPQMIERFYYGDFIAKAICDAVDAGLIPCSPKLGYVLKPPVLDIKRFGENVAVNRGVCVKAFESPEEVLDWLLQR